MLTLFPRLDAFHGGLKKVHKQAPGSGVQIIHEGDGFFMFNARVAQYFPHPLFCSICALSFLWLSRLLVNSIFAESHHALQCQFTNSEPVSGYNPFSSQGSRS